VLGEAGAVAEDAVVGGAVGHQAAAVVDDAVAVGLDAGGAAVVAVQIADDGGFGGQRAYAFGDEGATEVEELGTLCDAGVFDIEQFATAAVDLVARAPGRDDAGDAVVVGIIDVLNTGRRGGQAARLVEHEVLRGDEGGVLQAAEEDDVGPGGWQTRLSACARAQFAAVVPGVVGQQRAADRADLRQAQRGRVVVEAPVCAV